MTFGSLALQPQVARAVTLDPKADYAVNFNGTNAYGETVGAVIPTTGDYTVEAWVYNSSTSGMREIIAQGDDVNNFYMGDIWGGTRVSGANDLPPIKKNQWFHIAVTHGSSGSIIWVNGQKIAAAYGLGNPGNYNLNVGRQFLQYGEFWQGKIDEIKIWDNDRTNMVSYDMNTYGAGMGTGLLAYYDFNAPTFNPDGTVTVPDNASAAGLHPLTLHNVQESDVVDVAEKVDWGTDARDALVTFPRPYLNTQGGWTAPAGYEKYQALVVGGGGGGGAWIGGGGGGGAVTETAEASLTAGTKYTISVGMGGSGTHFRDGGFNRYGVTNYGSNGSPTNFNGTVISAGGGKGGSYNEYGQVAELAPGTGANGGGAAGSGNEINGGKTVWSEGGLPSSPSGFAGGSIPVPWTNLLPAAGGGGAGGAGGDASSDGRTAGNGGLGVASAITGLSYGGGGGGGVHGTLEVTDVGVVGLGTAGGANGAGPTAVGQSEVIAPSAVANTGGGGGGAAMNAAYTTIGGDGASGVIILRLVAAKVVTQTTVNDCDGISTLNGIKVAAAHPKIFYIDSGNDQKMDANYLAYRVTSTAARGDLWVEVSGFTGGSVRLANSADSAQPLGDVAAGGTNAAYFLAKASEESNKAQAHVVKVYDRKPGSGGALPLFTCNFGFSSVAETIKASANKVDSITTTTVSAIGTTFTITVLGDSGTIGAGNATDGRLMWLSPASRSTWPTQAMRLEDTAITTYSDSARSTVLKTYSNTLALNTAAGITSHNRQYYKAVYTFRVMGNAPAIASISPSAMISSGTQVKHVSFDSIPTGSTTKVNLVAPAETVTVSSSAEKTTEVREDGTTRITYKVKVSNSGSKPAEIDEVHDHGEEGEDYVKGSAKKDGKDEEDAEHDDDDEHEYTFSGPIKVPAKGSTTYEYQVEVKTCKVGEKYEYEHHSEGHHGGSDDDEDEDHDGHDDDGDGDGDGDDDHDDHSTHIGSSKTTNSHVKTKGNCGESTQEVKVVNQVQAPVVSTGTAVPVGVGSATIYGSIDPQGVAGLPLKFTYGTSPSLVGGTTVNLANTTAVTSPLTVKSAISGLSANTRYYYRLTVVNTGGAAISGTIFHFNTQEAPGVPTATTAAVTSISNTDKGALFTGAVTSARVPGGAKVRFEWATDAGNGACTSLGVTSTSGNLKDGAVDAILNNAGSTDMTFRATGFTASAKYCVRVVATHGANFSNRVVGSWMPWTQAPKTAQTLSWNSQMPPLPAGGTTTVSASSSSGLAVTYSSNDTAVCTVGSSTGAVTAVADSGVCSITATQEGDDTYYAALPKTISFDIVPPVVATETLPRGEYRASFATTTLDADGGDGTYSNWSVIGSLPAGLSLSNSGELSGTPTAAGIYSFAITVDSNGVTSAPRNFTIVIESAPVTITADDITVTFGDAVPAVAYQVAGLRGPDSSINVQPNCKTNYQVGDAANASGKTTSCEDAWDSNYAFSYVAGELTIDKFAIVVAAADAAKQNLSDGTNRPDPVFEYRVSPLPGGQTISDALPGGVTFTREPGETPKQYSITPQAVSVGANYTVTYLSGSLTIQNPLIVPSLTASDFSVTFGEELGSGLTAVARDGVTEVPGSWTFAYVDADGFDQYVTTASKLPAGLYTVTVIFQANDNTTYFGPLQTVMNVTVAKKVVTVTGTDGEKLVDTLDPTLGYTANGFLPGDSIDELGSINVERVAGETPGTYEVVTSGGSNPNYTVAHLKATFFITKLTIVPTVSPDGSNTRQLSITCQGAKPGSTITLTIGGATVGTYTVNANGTCPTSKITVPSSVPDGPQTVDAAGSYPSGAALTDSKPLLFVAPPANNGGGNNSGGGNNTGGNGGGSVNPKKLKVTKTFSGFGEGNPHLTKSMKAAIKSWVAANPKLSRVVCVGYTMGKTVLSDDDKLSWNRAFFTCQYIKSIKPSVKVVSVSGKQETKLGDPIRRVQITLSNY